MPRTATTSKALLALLMLRPSWSTYDLIKQLRRNMRFFWPRVESRIYDEARRLVELGLAAASQEHTGRRPRTVYTITDDGREAIFRWLKTSPRPTRLECEPLLRVFLADFSTREQLQFALDQVRQDAEAIQSVGRVVGAEYLAGTALFQDQVHVRSLVFDFLWSHAEMLRGWADRTEATLDSWEAGPGDDRKTAALSVIRGYLENGPPTPG